MEYKVVIYEHGGNYWIAGGQLAIKKKDTVHFYNCTGHDAKVKRDEDSDMDGWPGDFDIGKGKAHEAKFEEDGWYPYTVKVNGKEAEASKPILIVYP